MPFCRCVKHIEKSKSCDWILIFPSGRQGKLAEANSRKRKKSDNSQFDDKFEERAGSFSNGGILDFSG
jgi:hypothetical protein